MNNDCGEREWERETQSITHEADWTAIAVLDLKANDVQWRVGSGAVR